MPEKAEGVIVRLTSTGELKVRETGVRVLSEVNSGVICRVKLNNELDAWEQGCDGIGSCD